MKNNINSDDLEIECYSKIIDFFQKEKINQEETEIWKSQSIIELMNYLERTHNRTLVTNALILLLSLFEDIPPDTYNNRGVNINRLSEREKRSLMEDLKEEFLPN